MTNNELCYITAEEALQRFQNRELSPVELMTAVIQRAEAVEPTINAFSFTYFEEALAAAKTAETRYLNGTARPLEGIPLAVKDESYIEGQVTTNGSLLLQDAVAESTSIMIQRLLDAGAIVHARTTTPEFSVAVFTWSRLWGITRNPWNTAVTPGGSSGGSAASLAAGTTTLATGSDIGGSIRVPASLCGLVGYKAPYGRVPEDPPWNLEYYNHQGPLARTVGDCILMQNVIAGPHPEDIASLKPKLTLPNTYDGIKGWRIAYSIDLGYQAVDPEVRDNTLAALDVFRSLGAVVEEVDLGWTAETATAALDHLGYGPMGAYLRRFDKPGQRERLTDYVRYFIEMSKEVTVERAFRAEIVAGRMYATLGRLFERYNLFVCPTVANTGVAADFDYSQQSLSINGLEVEPKFGWVMTYPFNMLSRCPVLAVPSGQAANHVPTGIQLVGPAYEDAAVFQAAAAYKAASVAFFSGERFPNIG